MKTTSCCSRRFSNRASWSQCFKKLLFFVTDKHAKDASVLVPGTPFQHGLITEGKDKRPHDAQHNDTQHNNK